MLQVKMTWGKPFIVLVLVGIQAFLMHSPALGESLEDAWKIALASNHALKAAHNNASSAEMQVLAVKGLRLPTVELSSKFIRSSDRQSLKVDLMGQQVTVPVTEQGMNLHQAMAKVPLYTSGQITHAISAASSVAEAARLAEVTSERDIKLQIAEAYVNVLRAKSGLKVANSHVNSLITHKWSVDNLAEQGMVARNAQLAVEVALLDAQQQVLQVENANNLAKAAYNRLLSRPYDQDVVLEELPLEQPEQDLSSLIVLAQDSRSEIKMMDKQKTALLFSAEAIKKELMPVVGFQTGYQYIQNKYLSPDGQWIAAIGVTWNVFDGGNSRNRAAAVEQQASAAIEQKKEIASLIGLQVRQNWLDMKTSAKRIEVAKSGITQANENLRVASDRYANGLSTNTEVIDAEAMRTLSETYYENSQYDYVMAGIRLKYSVGKL